MNISSISPKNLIQLPAAAAAAATAASPAPVAPTAPLPAAPQPMLHHGVVTFFNDEKGYGWIAHKDQHKVQEKIFVHFSGIVGKGYKSLSEGDFVRYFEAPGRKGKEAVEVAVVKLATALQNAR